MQPGGYRYSSGFSSMYASNNQVKCDATFPCDHGKPVASQEECIKEGGLRAGIVKHLIIGDVFRP